jgi:hypothetical protein
MCGRPGVGLVRLAHDCREPPLARADRRLRPRRHHAVAVNAETLGRSTGIVTFLPEDVAVQQPPGRRSVMAFHRYRPSLHAESTGAALPSQSRMASDTGRDLGSAGLAVHRGVPAGDRVDTHHVQASPHHSLAQRPLPSSTGSSAHHRVGSTGSRTTENAAAQGPFSSRRRPGCCPASWRCRARPPFSTLPLSTTGRCASFQGCGRSGSLLACPADLPVARPEQAFRKRFVHPEVGTSAWLSGADTCSDVLSNDVKARVGAGHAPRACPSAAWASVCAFWPVAAPASFAGAEGGDQGFRSRTSSLSCSREGEEEWTSGRRNLPLGSSSVMSDRGR